MRPNDAARELEQLIRDAQVMLSGTTRGGRATDKVNVTLRDPWRNQRTISAIAIEDIPPGKENCLVIITKDNQAYALSSQPKGVITTRENIGRYREPDEPPTKKFPLLDLSVLFVVLNDGRSQDCQCPRYSLRNNKIIKECDGFYPTAQDAEDSAVSPLVTVFFSSSQGGSWLSPEYSAPSTFKPSVNISTKFGQGIDASFTQFVAPEYGAFMQPELQRQTTTRNFVYDGQTMSLSYWEWFTGYNQWLPASYGGTPNYNDPFWYLTDSIYYILPQYVNGSYFFAPIARATNGAIASILPYKDILTLQSAWENQHEGRYPTTLTIQYIFDQNNNLLPPPDPSGGSDFPQEENIPQKTLTFYVGGRWKNPIKLSTINASDPFTCYITAINKDTVVVSLKYGFEGARRSDAFENKQALSGGASEVSDIGVPWDYCRFPYDNELRRPGVNDEGQLVTLDDVADARTDQWCKTEYFTIQKSRVVRGIAPEIVTKDWQRCWAYKKYTGWYHNPFSSDPAYPATAEHHLPLAVVESNFPLELLIYSRTGKLFQRTINIQEDNFISQLYVEDISTENLAESELRNSEFMSWSKRSYIEAVFYPDEYNSVIVPQSELTKVERIFPVASRQQWKRFGLNHAQLNELKTADTSIKFQVYTKANIRLRNYDDILNTDNLDRFNIAFNLIRGRLGWVFQAVQITDRIADQSLYSDALNFFTFRNTMQMLYYALDNTTANNIAQGEEYNYFRLSLSGGDLREFIPGVVDLRSQCTHISELKAYSLKNKDAVILAISPFIKDTNKIQPEEEPFFPLPIPPIDFKNIPGEGEDPYGEDPPPPDDPYA